MQHNDQFYKLPAKLVNRAVCIILQMIVQIIIEEQLREKGPVYLLNQKIGNDGMKYLCLLDTANATKLLLSNNNIEPLGLINFCLGNWSNLTMISLSENKIGDKGCKFVTRAHIPRLQSINCNSNAINSAGVLHLSKAQWSQLKEVILDKNPMGLSSGMWLIKAKWEKCCSITMPENKFIFEEMMNFLRLNIPRLDFFVIRESKLDSKEKKLMKELIGRKFQKIELDI